MRARFFRVVGSLVAVLIQGCSLGTHDFAGPMLSGGVAGGALGAGTGAIIGASMTHGDVGASAALGTAIGVPVGLAGGALWYAYSQERRLDQNDAQILANGAAIAGTQRQIDQSRQELVDEQDRIELDTSRGTYLYTGPSLGNPYRGGWK